MVPSRENLNFYVRGTTSWLDFPGEWLTFLRSASEWNEHNNNNNNDDDDDDDDQKKKKKKKKKKDNNNKNTIISSQ